MLIHMKKKTVQEEPLLIGLRGMIDKGQQNIAQI